MTLEVALSDLAPRVLRYCVGYLGDRSLGEEVAQESLAALVQTWNTSGPPRNPDAFVFAIAKRRARRASFRRQLLVPLERLLNHRQRGPDPEQAAVEKDQRTRLLSAIRLLAAALLSTVSVLGQSPLQQRISVTYQGAAPASVFQAIADVLGHRLQLDGKVSGPVTLDVRNVSVETALRAVCESVGCRWRIDNGVLVVDRDASAAAQGQNDPLAHVSVRDVYEDLPVDIQWNAAPAEAAIKALARMLGAEPLVDRALVDKRVSLSVSVPDGGACHETPRCYPGDRRGDCSRGSRRRGPDSGCAVPGARLADHSPRIQAVSGGL